MIDSELHEPFNGWSTYSPHEISRGASVAVSLVEEAIRASVLIPRDDDMPGVPGYQVKALD